ncbi:hypothetical protein V7056_18500 [Bacillus sp. JJ664]
MKKDIILFSLVIILITSLSTVFILKKVQKSIPSRLLQIGYLISNNMDQIEFKKEITDDENQNAVDYIEGIFWGANRTTNPNVDLHHPDVVLFINSPRQGTRILNSMIWFTDNGVIIGVINGDNKIEFRILEKSEVEYFKNIISYKK